MINGILLINKEIDISSYDVIRKLKRVLPKGIKIGHAGTLDPFASGLLLVLLGSYTKKFDAILQMEKEYIVKGEFGYSTDTHDIKGEKVNISNERSAVEREKIENMIRKKFLGNISQMPPVFSAKKINGRKAYEYARKGESVKLHPKDILIQKFEIVEYDWPYVTFKIVCSSGTYVRTLINDLGIELGCFGTAVELCRTRIGENSLGDALDSVEITEGINLEKYVHE